jgi:quinol monooxygenase YgiN
MDTVQLNEKGNLLYCLGKVDETTYLFTELYTDMAHIKLHGSTDYFKAAGKKQAPFMGDRPSISVLQTVGNGGAKPTPKSCM